MGPCSGRRTQPSCRSADADDAAQEAWIAAWKALGEFRGHSSFRTWLLAIAWRKALDRRRGVAGWMRMLRIERGEDDDGRSVELTATGIDAEAAALDRAARARLKALVKGLPRAHRDALLLVATQGTDLRRGRGAAGRARRYGEVARERRTAAVAGADAAAGTPAFAVGHRPSQGHEGGRTWSGGLKTT